MKMQLQQWSRVCNPILPTIQLHPPKPTLRNPILHYPLYSRRHNLTLFDETIPPTPLQSLSIQDTGVYITVPIRSK